MLDTKWLGGVHSCRPASGTLAAAQQPIAEHNLVIFALAASVAPIGLVLFRRYIRVPEAGRQE